MAEEINPGIEDRFDAAVNVIRTLPANGSFQPSREMLLRFYALYKQAMEGPCTAPRPYFFDPGTVKWDAYHSLNGMSREAAMEEYVGELKKIVEMMSLTPEVSQFLDKLGSFYELVNDEGRTIVGGQRKDGPVPALKAKADSSSSSVDSHHGLTNGHPPDVDRLPQLIQTVSNLLNVPNFSSEEDSEDLDAEAFQDAVNPVPSDRRLSGDSFKSQPISPEPTRNELPAADLRVFQTLFPELEQLKKRTENLERRIMQHEQRLLAVEGKMEKAGRERGTAHCNGMVADAGRVRRPLWSQSQNSFLRLIGRYFHLMEERFRQYPAVTFLIALIWPLVVQVVICVYRRNRKSR